MPKLITSDIVERRVDRTTYSAENPKSSGYCEDQGTTQYLMKRFKFLGVVFWQYTLDKEDVPAFAVLEKSFFGSTSWKSKFYEYI